MSVDYTTASEVLKQWDYLELTDSFCSYYTQWIKIYKEGALELHLLLSNLNLQSEVNWGWFILLVAKTGK